MGTGGETQGIRLLLPYGIVYDIPPPLYIFVVPPMTANAPPLRYILLPPLWNNASLPLHQNCSPPASLIHCHHPMGKGWNQEKKIVLQPPGLRAQLRFQNYSILGELLLMSCCMNLRQLILRSSFHLFSKSRRKLSLTEFDWERGAEEFLAKT